MCVHVKSLQSCPAFCDHVDCSPPDDSVHGILQARILEWVAKPSSRDLPDPGTELTSLMPPVLAGGFFTTSATLEGIHHTNTNCKIVEVAILIPK